MTFLEKLSQIKTIVSQWHKDQTYAGHKPYTYHLDQVLFVALEFGITDEDIILATRLHDSIEDVDGITKETIAAIVNERVAQLVYAVSNEPGKNREERHKKTYPKTRSIPGGITLKLCDRVANVRQCWEESQRKDGKRNSLLGMYKKEYGSFRKALYLEDLSEIDKALWEELDRLLAWENP